LEAFIMHPSRVEAYLDELERPLAHLPASERREWREEARQHLLSLAAAHEELGASPQEAVDAAVREFGDPGRIGRDLARAQGRWCDRLSSRPLLFVPISAAAWLLGGLVQSGGSVATALIWAGWGAVNGALMGLAQWYLARCRNTASR
jgi:hypothetical protein